MINNHSKTKMFYDQQLLKGRETRSHVPFKKICRNDESYIAEQRPTSTWGKHALTTSCYHRRVVTYFCVNQCWMKNVLSDGGTKASVTGIERGKGKSGARARLALSPSQVTQAGAITQWRITPYQIGVILLVIPSLIIYCNHIKLLFLLRYFHTIPLY